MEPEVKLEVICVTYSAIIMRHQHRLLATVISDIRLAPGRRQDHRRIRQHWERLASLSPKSCSDH
jgi:hypothetical protein